jgi:hypothetical protein
MKKALILFGLAVAGLIYIAFDESSRHDSPTLVVWNLVDSTTDEVVVERVTYERCMAAKARWQATEPTHWFGCTYSKG